MCGGGVEVQELSLVDYKQLSHPPKKVTHQKELGTLRPGTEGFRAFRAWDPQKSPKRVRKESERVSRRLRPWGAPESPKSAPRSPKRVQKRSFGLFLDSFRTPGRPLWGFWGSPGPEAHPFGLFSDSFGVPGPKGPGALCARPGGYPPERALELTVAHFSRG